MATKFSQPTGNDSTPPSFDSAFDAALQGDPADTPPAADPAPPADPAAPAVDPAPPADPAAPAADPAPAVEPAADPADPAAPAADPAAPAVDPNAPAADPAPTPTLTAEDIVKGLQEALTKQQTAQQGQPQPQPQAEGAPQPEPIYSTDEQALLTEYEKNWPDVAAAEALKRRGEYHDLLKYVFTEVHGFLQPHLSQLSAVTNTLHTSELERVVEGYSPAIEADVEKWIDTQPQYLQAPYKQVMQTGTSEEVADLIGRYRAATGSSPAPAQPAAQPAAAQPTAQQTELSNLAKQAAQSLAPVSSDRTQPAAGEDPGDFETAFARYASEAAAP